MAKKSRLSQAFRDADDISRILTDRGLAHIAGKIWGIWGKEVFGTPAPKIDENDPYRILEIRQGASELVVKAAYRSLAKKHHPDAGGDPEMFKRVQAAYETIQKERGEK